MRISALRLGIALVLVSSTVAYATLSADGDRAETPAAKAAFKSAAQLKARGRVAGLYPGAVKAMRVRVRNRYRVPVRLGYIKTRTLNAGPGCGGENLVITRRRTRVRIGSHKKRFVNIKVQMIGDAADACQGARFPLRFTVKGKRL